MDDRKPVPRDLSMSPKWGAFALYLPETERYLAFRAEPSISGWIKQYANQTNRKVSSLWRMLSAGKYYFELCALLANLEQEFPGLEEACIARLCRIARDTEEDLPRCSG